MKEGDKVWVFFENGDPNNPIIWSRCNIKDFYPEAGTGSKPDWHDNITKDSDIDEDDLKFTDDTYNKIHARDYGENIHSYFDEENKQFILYSDNWYIALSKDKNCHLSVDNLYLKATTKMNIHAGQNIVKIDGDGIRLENTALGKFTIKNSTKTLKGILQDFMDKVINMKTVGPPPQHVVHPSDKNAMTQIKDVDIPLLFDE